MSQPNLNPCGIGLVGVLNVHGCVETRCNGCGNRSGGGNWGCQYGGVRVCC